MSSGPGNILITIGAHTADAVRGIGQVDKALGESMTAGQKATAGLKKAALPAAAALGAIGFAAVGATKAALEDAAAQDKLSGQLKRVTGATDAQVKAAEDYITKLSLQTGVADDELRPALGKLATATKDVGKAQETLSLALDISAQTGKSLDTVTTALAKGYGGSTTAIGKLVPGMDKAVLASKDMTKITAELADLTGGAAADAADTSAGKFKVMENQMNELQETLGTALIPVIDALLPLLSRAAKFAADNSGAIKILVGVVAALAAGILIANAAIKVYETLQLAAKAATAVWTAAQWLLNAALSANPLALIVIGLAALGVALVEAYKHSQTFRNIVDAAFDAVLRSVDALKAGFNTLRNAAFLAWDWIQDHWKLALFAFGPVGAAVALIASNFDTIKGAAQTAFNYVATVWTVGKFAFGAVTSAVQGIADAFTAIYNAVRTAIGAVQDLIGWLSRIHVPKIKLPHIPNPFGVMAPAPQLVGMPRASQSSAARATTGGGGITVNVYGAIDPEGTARAINRVLWAHDRRQGRRP